MNVVVVAIIAVLVLVVVAITFTGGVAKSVERMRAFFNIGVVGQDLEFVREQCRAACDTAKLSSDASRSRFCTATFDVKEGTDTVKYACFTGNKPEYRSVGIPCEEVQCT